MTNPHTIRDEFQDDADALARALQPCTACATVEGQAFVVVGALGPLRFDVTRKGPREWHAVASGLGLAHQVNRFDRDAAETLAKATGGTARHWRDAAADQLRAILQCLAMIDAAADRRGTLTAA